jgi:uncharacterized protein YhjY with autotransporter beta-barrel domain
MYRRLSGSVVALVVALCITPVTVRGGPPPPLPPIGGGPWLAALSGLQAIAADTLVLEGDQSAGVRHAGSSFVPIVVRNLTKDITPAAGRHGIEVRRAGGVTIDLRFRSGGHGIQTRGDVSHGIAASSLGTTGGNGANDYSGFNPFYPVSYGGNGIAGGNGGGVFLESDGSITTDGTGSHGIFGFSWGGNGGRGGHAGAIAYAEGGNGGTGGRGGDVLVRNAGSITTHGDFSAGMYLVSVGGTGGNGGDAGAAAAQGGRGGGGGQGGTIDIVNEGSITTEGDWSLGIWAQSLGGVGGAGGAGGGIYGSGGGANASGAGGMVTVRNSGTILTQGLQGSGIFVQSIGGFGASGGGSGGIASFGGIGATGGNGGLVLIDNSGAVTTLGNEANGLFAESVGGGGGNGAGSGGVYSLGGAGSAGGHGGQVGIANSATLRTEGYFAQGILAQSIGGGGGNGAGSGGLVSIGGSGTSTGNGSFVSVHNSGGITTLGDDSHAILAQSIGGGGGSGAGSGGMVSIGGSGNAGGNGGAVEVWNGGSLRTEGVSASAILAQSVGGGGGNGGSSGGLASFGGKGSVTSHGGRVTVVNSGNIETGLESPEEDRPVSVIGSQAIFAQSVGGGGGNGGSSGGLFSIGGSGGGGGNGSVVRVENAGSLTTREDNSSAIFAQSVGGGGGNGGGSAAVQGVIVPIAIGGSGAGGGQGDSVGVYSDGVVTTEGDRSHGIFAQSVGGGGGNGGFAVSGSIATPVRVSVGGTAGGGGNGGVVEVFGGSDITTSGMDAHGIVAQSVGGGGGTGGFAVSSSLGGGVAWNIGVGGTGGVGGSGSAVTVGTASDPFGGSITTSGERSYGILAQSIGGGGGNGGFVVTGAILGGASVNLGFGGKGGVGGSGSMVRVASGADILTTGSEAHGIVAQSVGGGGGTGGFSIAAGVTAFGGSSFTLGGEGGSGSKGGKVDVTSGGRIETEGDYAHGILAQSIGGGGGNGGMSGSAMVNFSGLIPMPPEIPVSVSANFAIGLGGKGGSGGTADSVVVTNDGGIITHGDFSQGIVAQSIGGGGGNGGKAIAATANIGLTTDISPSISVDFGLALGGSGGTGNHGGVVDVKNNGGIDTEGDGAHGILAQSIGGGGGTGGSARALTLGLDPSEWVGVTNPLAISQTVDIAIGGSGGAAGNGSLVRVESSGGILTRGADAHGIFAQSIGGGGGAGGGGYHGLDLSDLGVPEELIPDWGTLESPIQSLQDIQVVVGGRGGASGHGGAVDIHSSGGVWTLGDGSFGILAQSIGGGGGIGGVGALGDGTVGLGGRGGAAGNGDAVTIEASGPVETSGIGAHAIVAQSIGGGGGIAGNVDGGMTDFGLKLAIGGNGGSAGGGGAVTVNASGDIVTRGQGSSGILAQSVGGGGGIGGDFGPGLGFMGSAGGDGSGGAVSVDLHGSITTYGDRSHGIIAQSAGGQNDQVWSEVTHWWLPDHLDFGSGVDVRVDGDVRTYGEDSHGIIAQSLGSDGNGDITVTIESGTVQGGTGEGVGVLILDGNENTLANSGSITTLGGIEGTAVLGTGGNEFIENMGTIVGSIDLGGGINNFRNETAGRFDAGSTIDLGTGGVFTNDGTLSLGGADGVITTTLTGDYVQTEDGTFEVTVSGGESDQLILEQGSATVDGTLKVVADHEAYQDGATYDLIQTGPGQDVSGEFSDIVLPKTAFLDFQQEYVDGSLQVTVDVKSFSSAATNPVERAVGGYLDTCLAYANGDMSHLIGMFQIVDLDQVKEAFATLSPDTYDNLTRGSMQTARLHEDALGQRMNAARWNPWDEAGTPPARSYGERGGSWWVSGVRQSADQDASEGYLAHNFIVTEAMGGYERSFGGSLLGASFGGTQGDVDRDNDMANGSVDSYLGSLYGGLLFGRNYAQSVVTYAMGTFDNKREISVGSLSRTAQSSHDGQSFSATLGLGRRVDLGRIGIEPSAAARYITLSEDAFTETGAGSASLVVSKRTSDWLGSDVGVRFLTTFMGERSAWLPELSAVWNHDFGIDDRVITAAFDGAPDETFTLAGQGIDPDGFSLGAGLAYHTSSGWKASLRYDRSQRGDYTANSFSLRLGSDF